MTNTQTQQPAGQGHEPMTNAQRADLADLCDEANEAFDGSLTKSQAAQRIEELRARAGSGVLTETPKGMAPANEGPLESLGRAIGEAVTGSKPAAG